MVFLMFLSSFFFHFCWLSFSVRARTTSRRTERSAETGSTRKVCRGGSHQSGETIRRRRPTTRTPPLPARSRPRRPSPRRQTVTTCRGRRGGSTTSVCINSSSWRKRGRGWTSRRETIIRRLWFSVRGRWELGSGLVLAVTFSVLGRAGGRLPNGLRRCCRRPSWPKNLRNRFPPWTVSERFNYNIEFFIIIFLASIRLRIYPPITYSWTVPLILDHSYLFGRLTSSKIADTKVSGF